MHSSSVAQQTFDFAVVQNFLHHKKYEYAFQTNAYNIFRHYIAKIFMQVEIKYLKIWRNFHKFIYMNIPVKDGETANFFFRS